MATGAWAANALGLPAEWKFDEGRGDVARDSGGNACGTHFRRLAPFSLGAQEHRLVNAAHHVGRRTGSAASGNGVDEVPNTLAHADETALGK